ncbi:AAA family ATPase [Mesorhizobium sp. M0239]|uniref:AAA family ATPase n=1 Tax=Mesorhizobium sp. M0239 TaxID=2956924 RepID=UPI00333A1802
MRYEPTLIVTRVVVERGKLVVYDEKFHEGVNVVRGDNSSGKSTVLNFIFYGLGGELGDWSAVARLCTRVIVEARINGRIATLSREISETSGQQPMEIFGGPFELSLGAARSEWVRYPYKTTNNRESFSQAIFTLLGIPEVSSDLSGNITMHQILRLLYADQLSPIEDIFRFERFDQANLRDTVGRLLCGAYDSALYDNDQKIKEYGKELDKIIGQLHSLFLILGKVGGSDQGLTPEWIEAQRKSLAGETAANQNAIEKAEQALFASKAEDEFTLEIQNKVYREVQELQSNLVYARQERDGLTLTIVDSDSFLSSLRSKVDALKDSAKVVEHIGEVRFQWCPACYAPLDDDPVPHSCHLCKTPFDSEQTQVRVSALILDTSLQISQSEELQKKRKERLTQLDTKLHVLEEQWRRASMQLASAQRLPSTLARERLGELHRRSGYLDRQAEDLEQKAHLVETVRALSSRREDLEGEIAKLKSKNEALRAQQQNRLSIAYTRIADEVKELLRNDLRRQDIFEDPKEVSFTFGGNKVSVDGENYFSASSRAVLKSSFYLGFLAAATKTDFFRHPRFCMIDTHENMGVEAIRSQNFQLQILRVSKESKVEHQIIYATAMIEPELEDNSYTVGAFSTSDDKTIAIRLS